jgi:hypothetical protein
MPNCRGRDQNKRVKSAGLLKERAKMKSRKTMIMEYVRAAAVKERLTVGSSIHIPAAAITAVTALKDNQARNRRAGSPRVSPYCHSHAIMPIMTRAVANRI